MIQTGSMVWIYRCGWCGFPTDAGGTALPFSVEQANAYIAEHASAGVWKTNGSCCQLERAETYAESGEHGTDA